MILQACLYAYDLKAVEADRRSVALDSMGIIPDQDLIDYTQSVLDRIASRAPKTPLSSKVYLMASMSPGALTMPSGDIFLNHSIFEYAGNEDQLAFVLAHELSHALLRHDRTDFIEVIRPYIVTAIDIAVSSADGDDQTRKALKLYGTDLITRDLLMPVWDRRKESEADRLAIDLMVAAGYNPSEAINMLSYVGEFEASFEADHVVERNALEKAVLKNKGEPVENNKFNLGNLLAKGMTEFQQVFGGRHPDADERMRDVFVYMEREYPDALYKDLQHEKFTQTVAVNEEILNKYKVAYQIGRELASEEKLTNAKFRKIEKSARWAVTGSTENHAYTRRVFAQLRESQGKYDLALKNLEMTYDSDGILPGAMERDRVQWLDILGKRDVAFARVKEVGEFYEWPLIFYPDAIRLAKQTGSKEEETNFRIACIAKYPQNREVCQ